METRGATPPLKPQLKCFGRRNRSKPKDVSQDDGALNGKLDPVDVQVRPEQSSAATTSGSKERGLGPGESERDSGGEAPIESGRNADAESEPRSPVLCVQATEVLDELPEIVPRFRSEEEQVAYEDHIMYRSHEIWTRQEALEHKRIPPKWKEPPHEKTHWDFVIDEMTWLAKDFEKERKWKLASAKRLAQKASKARTELDVKGLRRIKSEEQRIRRIASNMAKEVKKFWVKIEKLVVYKHQLAVDEKKKKALDKHLNFLLGQTERYSSMLAVNLANVPEESESPKPEEEAPEDGDVAMADEDFVCDRMEEEDDEATLDADEALITADERKEELNALERESELPLEELLRLYSKDPPNGDEEEEEDPGAEDENGDAGDEDDAAGDEDTQNADEPGSEADEEFESFSGSEAAADETDDLEYTPNKSNEPDEDDEQTFDEEEKLAIAEGQDSLSELEQLKAENELPVSELLARYRSMQELAEAPEEPENDDTAEARERMGEPSTSGRTPLLIIKDPKHKQVHNFSEGTDLEAQVLANITRAAQQRGERIKKRAEKEEQMERNEGKTGRKELDEAAAEAQSAQPTGYTFSTTRVRTKLPFLLKHSLREYQHIGLDWLVTMYEKRLNGILADEMGLGKTIMTIALLAHLACEKGIWGPHLIVVPTSVMLNWETEFMKWCPAFKLLTYFGSAKERKIKRQGWSKLNSFHVCITTYRLVIQDAKAFKRKKWKYLILDEAHLIKNWKSQRWQMLLNFNSKRRILLTGTPLQNDLMELWSLMHFLMPHVFQSHQEFKDWFSNPITGMIEGQEKVNQDVVDRLHNVLRPFLLRRLKRDVEKQLPGKHEHVVPCRLSKRQRNLYEDFMASSDTQATLSSGNFLGLINVLMQLRKVCNHPDLFESRPIVSSFDMPGLELQFCSEVCSVVQRRDSSRVDLRVLNLLLSEELELWEAEEISELATPRRLIEEIASTGEDSWQDEQHDQHQPVSIFEEIQAALRLQRFIRRRDRARHQGWLNSLRCAKQVLYGPGVRRLTSVEHPVYDIHPVASDPTRYLEFSSIVAGIVKLPSTWLEELDELLKAFVFVIPAARAPPPVIWCSHPVASGSLLEPEVVDHQLGNLSELLAPMRPVIVRRQLFFPDRRLLQFDCGKLQQLSVLLRRLKSEGHRALIFTQMTKMLDILESFINLYGYTYMRLDGSTKPEQRQILMQRFNTNPKIFLFILSTRSGGVGINLVGADTVIFYDSDWNPAMDQQAQDRCHRIGQTREVNIYRLVSESTIEENILKKANQKRFLDDLVIQSGGYNTEFFKKLDPMELLSGVSGKRSSSASSGEQLVSSADVDAALKSAEDEADYMAMKNAELEEEAGIQEFAEDVSVDDDAADDLLEDGKAEGKASEGENLNSNKENKENAPAPETMKEIEATPGASGAPGFMDAEEEMDMLADVKQLAAAAAASGRGSNYFEDQLKPIERYAIRFMDLWDPIIDSAALETLETEVAYEEKEWELEQLEKLKEEQEAEIDEDDEPLVYENWDTSHADAAYRQEVEALTQQQELMQAEWEAMQEEELENAARLAANQEKKAKKKKFKSLGRGSLGPEGAHEAAEDNETHEVEVADEADEVLSGGSDEMMMMDYDMQWPLRPSPSSISHRKRKAEEWSLEGESKRFRDLTGSSRPRFLISVYGKKPLILLERDKKKDSLKNRSNNEAWSSEEDVILCAVASEYGGSWRLASDALQGMPEGGFYCGRYRHPGKCKDRYKSLVTENACGDINNISSAMIKVTEEDSKRLLRIVERVPDQDLLLQRHFASILKTRDSGSKTPVAPAAAPSTPEPRSLPFVSLAELSKGGGVKAPVSDAQKKQGFVLVAEALRSSEHENNGKLVEQAKPVAIRETMMELTLSFPDLREDEDFTPLSLILREEHRPRLTSAPSSVLRMLPVIETRYRKTSELTPEKFAASAFPAALRPPPLALQAPVKRQASPNDLTKAQRMKQAKASPAKNGVVEIRPVEMKNLSFSPSQLKPANLKKPPLFNPVRVHTITTQGSSRLASQAPSNSSKSPVGGSSAQQQQQQQQASFAQYWRPDFPQAAQGLNPRPSSNTSGNSSRPGSKPVNSRVQNHSPQQQQQQRQTQSSQQQSQQQRQLQQQQQRSSSQPAEVSLSLSLAPPGTQQGTQRKP